MCDGPIFSKPKTDPAKALADVLMDNLGGCITTTALRKMIRTKWERIKVLAHEIHDEETDALRVEQRKARAELDNYAKYA